MRQNIMRPYGRRAERGITLVLVAFGLVVILGISALAIDLASLYVARNEAQRAADAGALAGAKVFVETACTTLSNENCTASNVQALATARATAAATQNVLGIDGNPLPSNCVSVTFPDDEQGGGNGNPQITVTVNRVSSCSNAVPTFFARALRISSVNISAVATAEAFNPSGASSDEENTSPTICAACMKPLLVPNCDPAHTSPKNNSCPGSASMASFVDPSSGQVQNPGTAPSGIVGQQWQLHRQGTTNRWYVLDVGCGSTSAAFSQCLTQCAPKNWACGGQPNTVNPSSFGAMNTLFNTMIHASGDGPSNRGQDSIVLNLSGNPPYTITGGSNNPNSALKGVQQISSSDSLITVAIFNGATPALGNNVTIIGYMQLFVQYVQHITGPPADDVMTTTILNVAGCGSTVATCGTSGETGTVTGGGAGMLPVRLVQTSTSGGGEE